MKNIKTECYWCNRLFDDKTEIIWTGGYPTCKYSYWEYLKRSTIKNPNREKLEFIYCYDKNNKYFIKENK